jgi:hypothetical protein
MAEVEVDQWSAARAALEQLKREDLELNVTKSSPVWKLFGIYKNNQLPHKAVCLHCQGVLERNTGTSNLQQHAQFAGPAERQGRAACMSVLAPKRCCLSG